MDIVKKHLKERPNSTKINLSFSQLDDVESIMSELYQFKKLEILNLSANRMVSLPDDLSILRKLKALDLTHNGFSNINKVVNALKTIPLLRELRVSAKTEDENLFQNGLPKLEIFNGRVLKAGAVEVLANNGIQANSDANKNNSDEAKRNKELRNKYFNKVLPFGEQDSNDLQRMFNHLDNDAKISLDGNYLSDKNQANQEMRKIISDFRANVFAKKLKPNEHNKHVMSNKVNMVNAVFDTVQHVTKNYSDDMHDSLKVLFDYTRILLHNFVEYYNCSNDPASWAQENDSYSFSKTLRKGTTMTEDNSKQSSTAWLLTKKEQESEISRLKDENERCHTQLIKNAKHDASSLGPALPPALAKPVLADSYFSPENQTVKGLEEKTGQIRVKNLTLNQLKDTIHEVMTNKLAADKKSDEIGANRETLEQYMYTYLSKKYGLKSLVVEWASSIIESIKNYSNDDGMVKLFAKMLKNECDEEFYWTQNDAKDSIKNLISVMQKNKNNSKNKEEIRKIVDNYVNSTISRGECNDLLKHIYGSCDYEYVKNDLDMFCAQDHLATTLGNNFKIRYKDFEDVVLNYQLRSHQEFLTNYIKKWRKFDTDHDGVISYDDCYKLLKDFRMDSIKLDSEKLIKELDPKMTNAITFSGLCEKLSSTQEDQTNSKKSLLQSVSLIKS